ncbi:gamma-glutamyl-gamma-aminobutyrate hydrolase family protein [Terasakiella sp. A23]|uniref:gamma-glutamyl-gamma-aminobutyrate hydrolase family protein n=1 Tax=Terasakiella sp. FCG-A23 TaxID=3080561 RepID=UPI0029556EB3|nr:gamma-glutamyl-gamma-aminobutyrate hydrolase family protein [Terasakiella sp. A23]MDV7340924.1 gamma-glutamyl-gamma-aminobutyrate hydrolase family protein [Terasakiella sp. A23]
MAKRPKIGVTASERTWSPGWWFTALALLLVGAKPKRIGLRHHPDTAQFDAIVIGGGDDIHPDHYGGKLNQKVRIDLERDQLEIEWIKWAISKRIPLMGICRGAQLINVVLSGTLHQDIRTIRKLTYNRPGLLPTKQVRLEENSLMSSICGKNRIRVNSLHHQAIKSCGSSLNVVGWDLDKITQAIESSAGQKIVAVQWHPEYMFYMPSQLALFKWLRESAEE